MNLGTIVKRIMKFGPISGLAFIWNSIRLRYKKFRSLQDHFFKYRPFTKSLLKRKSLLVHFLKIHFLLSRLRKLKLFFLQAINFKSLPIQFQKLNFLSQYLVKLRSLSLHFMKFRFRSYRLWRLKIEDIRGRHVVIGGLLIYFFSFLIGIRSIGVSILDDNEPGDSVARELIFLGDAQCSKTDSSNDQDLLIPSGDSRSIKDHESPVPKILSDGTDCNPLYTIASNSLGDTSKSASSDMNVPVSFLKKIFLNNLGLNIIIITGAFSLLAFSMIVLVFNALHIGMLVKGIYNSYGLKLAAVLVFPHLFVEVISHFLSLYIAYLILRQIIVPIVLRGEAISHANQKARNIVVLFSLVIFITFMAAVIEIYVTPKLI